MVYPGTRVWISEDFGAWRWTKFDAELNINEKIKRIMGEQVIGSRIQGKNKLQQKSKPQKPRQHAQKTG